MLEAFVGRGRLDGRGFRVREEAALGDEHPRQAAAKVEWARARGVWWERIGFRLFLGGITRRHAVFLS
jgi:hypothetical protein